MPPKKEGTYYERNRDHLLKYQMDRRDASTTEQKAKRKQYHDEYYQARKEEINAKRRARTAERNIKKLASKEMSEAEVKVEVEKVIEEKKKKKREKREKDRRQRVQTTKAVPGDEQRCRCLWCFNARLSSKEGTV